MSTTIPRLRVANAHFVTDRLAVGGDLPFDNLTAAVHARELVEAGITHVRAKLLTHCHMGVNRGPSAGYAVLLGLGWDPVEAIDAIRRARRIAHVWYAEDALRWHHDRIEASPERRWKDLARLVAWRVANPLDVVRVIADQRLL